MIKENQISRLPNLFERAESLRERKSVDYNSTIDLVDYFPRGIEDVTYMIHVKTTRLKSLVENSKNQIAPRCEGIEDTLIDLVNYASFAYDIIIGNLQGQTSKDIFNPRPKETLSKVCKNLDVSDSSYAKEPPHGFG